MAEAAAELGRRQQFEGWAEGLCEELSNLSEARTDLEQQLSTKKEEQRKLQADLGRAQRRCKELEQVAERSAQHGQSAAERAEENAALRKQLSAYGTEIDVLRKEKEKGDETIGNVFAEMRDLAAERDRLRGAEDPGDDVGVAMTVRGPSLQSLGRSAALLQSFKDTLRQAVAATVAAQRGEVRAALDQVTLEGLFGSPLRAQLAVAPPRGGSATELCSRLDAQLLCECMRQSLEAVQGLQAACEEPLIVEQVSAVRRCRKAECGQLHSAQQELQEAHSALQREAASLRMQLQEEQARRADAESQLAAYVAQMEEKVRAADDRSHDHQRRSSMAVSDREAFSQLAQELFGIVQELQERYVEQTRHYHEFAERVRREQTTHAQEIDEADRLVEVQHQFLGSLYTALRRAKGSHADHTSEGAYWRTEAEKYEAKLHQLYGESRATADHVRTQQDEVAQRKDEEEVRRSQEAEAIKAKQRMSLDRWRKVADPNIAKFMSRAQEGINVQKVQALDKHQLGKPLQLGWRMMRVVVEERPTGDSVISLQWRKQSDRKWTERSTVPVQNIKVVCYGLGARAPWLDELVPERCFSVFSLHRSFDFVCQEEADCEAFVLTLSRLCCRVQKWPVIGSINSHHKFLCARGWCKVQNTCRKKKKTLALCLKEALLKAAEDSRVGGRGSGGS